MDGFGDLHEDDGDCSRKRAGQPSEGIITLRWEEGKELRDTEARESADEVAADEGTGLGQR